MSKNSQIYVTYTKLAEKAGMTVPEVKRALRSRGYLRGDEITDKAQRYRVAEIRAVTQTTRVKARMKDVYTVWDMARVLRMLKRSGVTRDARKITVSREQYAQRMNEITIELAHHVSGRKPANAQASADILHDMCEAEDVFILVDAVFEDGCDLMWNFENVISGACDRFYITERVIGAVAAVVRERPEPSRHLAMVESIHTGMEAFIDRRIAKERPAISERKKERNE